MPIEIDQTEKVANEQTTQSAASACSSIVGHFDMTGNSKAKYQSGADGERKGFYYITVPETDEFGEEKLCRHYIHADTAAIICMGLIEAMGLRLAITPIGLDNLTPVENAYFPKGAKLPVGWRWL